MSKLKSKYFFSILIILIVVGIIRLPYFFLPLDRDEGAYAYIGLMWLKGHGIPYLNFFDNKPPVTHLLFGLASLIKGNTFLSIRILSFFYTEIIILVFYLFMIIFANFGAAVFSTGLFGLYVSSIELEGSYFNTEIQAMLPLILFIFLIWKMKESKQLNYKAAFLTGILGSTSILMRQTTLYVVLLLILWHFLLKKSIKTLCIIFLGIVLPFLLFGIYFYKNNALGDLYTFLIYYNRRYTEEGFRLADILRAGGSNSFLGYIGWFIRLPATLAGFVGITIFNLIISKKVERGIKTPLIFGALIVLSSWIGVKTAGSRGFAHYYLALIPGFCIMSAIFFKNMAKRKQELVIIASLLLLVGWLVAREYKYWLSAPYDIQKKQFGGEAYWFEDAPKVAEWIKGNTLEDDTFLIWANEPEIYFYTGKKTDTKYINFYGFYYLPEEEKIWLQKQISSPPKWVVTYTDDPTYKDFEAFTKKQPCYREKVQIGKFLIHECV
jgi:hypothetical protein